MGNCKQILKSLQNFQISFCKILHIAPRKRSSKEVPFDW